MLRILINGGMSATGGISKFILDNYSRINNTPGISFFFVIDRTEENEQKKFMDDHHMSYKLITPFRINPFAFFYQWIRFFIENGKKFDVVHFQWDSLKKFYLIWLSKLFGIKKIVVHSHNSEIPLDPASQVMFNIGRKVVKHNATVRIACGQNAAKWFFYPEDNVKIIRNGINIDEYKYSFTERKEYRLQFGIESNTLVYIHVGHFGEQKNQSFLIDIFKEIHDKKKSVRLFLVGEGEQLQQMKDKVKQYGLSKEVFFLGKRNDVNKLLSFADFMIFPSKHEGLPFALVEAQTSGLPVVCADTIDSGVCMLKTTKQLSLKMGSRYWAEQILMMNKNMNRDKASKVVQLNGYDINDTCQSVLKIYTN